MGKRKELDNKFKSVPFFPYPIFSLTFVYSQLTSTKRSEGGSAKENGSGRLQNFEPIPRFGCFRRNEHIKQVRVRKPSHTLNLIYSARLSYPIDAIVLTRSLRAIRRARPVHNF